jgi:hypothetical protein
MPGAPWQDTPLDLQQAFWNATSVSLFLTVAAIIADLDDAGVLRGRCVRNSLIVDTKGSIKSGS